MKNLYFTVATGALLLGLVAMPAQALDVGVGGNSSGGTTGSASQGGTSGTATIGGGNNVGSVKTTTGGNNATIDIGRTSGPLVSGSQNGDPLGDDSNTDVDVNLGALGGLIGGIGVDPGGGSVEPSEVTTAVNAMSGAEQQELKSTCNSVVNAPRRYDAGIVQLCKLIISL
jgi:hypothetical protein